ncbi:MAG: winged helix-turn-helix domain-containing protein [Alphaproteobacteria bacterium]
MARVFLRIDLGPAGAIGPGKVRLLEHIGDSGSISAAARAMRMSYRRAWLLIDALNKCFGRPVVSASTGGSHGGGATLTRLGVEIIKRYRDMERAAERAMARHLAALDNAAIRERSGGSSRQRAPRPSNRARPRHHPERRTRRS